jgi:hypothetical protein
MIHELWALYQGWASAQPRASSKNKGFSPDFSPTNPK